MTAMRRRFGTGRLSAVVAAAVMVLLVQFAGVPAATANTPAASGCNAATTPAGQISSYPAWGRSRSSLRVACVFEHNTTEDDVTTQFTIHDFKNVLWHNGAARTVTTAATVGAGATTFTITDCTDLTGWVNRGITTADNSAGMASGAFVKSISAGCVVTLKGATTATLPANTKLKIENSNPRTLVDASFTGGGNVLTSAAANFTTVDTNLSLAGTQVPLGVTITVLTSSTAQLNGGATFTGSGSFTNQTISIGDTYQSTDARTVDDASIGGGGTTITSTAAKFDTSTAQNDVGLQVYGTGITEPCYIASTTATVATLSSACASPGSRVTIGDPSATAPQNGEPVADLGFQAAVNPTFDPLAPPCADNIAQQFHIAGTWVNPGSFASTTATSQPASTKAIGAIEFRVGTLTVPAFVVETPPTGDGLIGALHDNITFRSAPWFLICGASASSIGMSFSLGIAGSTPAQIATSTNSGRPGTKQLRLTEDNAETGSTTTAYFTSDAGPTLVDTGQYHRLCLIPAGPPTVGFQCGTG